MPSSLLANDLGAYPSPHLAVDIVLFTMNHNVLKVVTMERTAEPFAGQQVLPGGFVHPGETLDTTAKRVLSEKAGLPELSVEQLYTFSQLGRDPRGWVVSVVYFVLVPYEQLLAAAGELADRGLPAIEAAANDPQMRLVEHGKEVTLGFDHAAIVWTALSRLRGKLDWSSLPFALLPPKFTLLELQQVHEAVLGRPLNKPHFRKKWHNKLLAGGVRLKPTRLLTSGRRHRPAELYQLEVESK